MPRDSVYENAQPLLETFAVLRYKTAVNVPGEMACHALERVEPGPPHGRATPCQRGRTRIAR